MSKHTPGPWKLEINPKIGYIYVLMGTYLDDESLKRKDQHLVELPIDPNDKEAWEEAIANMRLMSAAPDLLVAAEEALALLQADIPDNWRDRVCRQLQTAITKAKGGEQQ